MPEGDTVYRAARNLHEVLAGAELTRSDFRVPSSKHIAIRVQEAFADNRRSALVAIGKRVISRH